MVFSVLAGLAGLVLNTGSQAEAHSNAMDFIRILADQGLLRRQPPAAFAAENILPMRHDENDFVFGSPLITMRIDRQTRKLNSLFVEAGRVADGCQLTKLQAIALAKKFYQIAGHLDPIEFPNSTDIDAQIGERIYLSAVRKHQGVEFDRLLYNVSITIRKDGLVESFRTSRLPNVTGLSIESNPNADANVPGSVAGRLLDAQQGGQLRIWPSHPVIRGAHFSSPQLDLRSEAERNIADGRGLYLRQVLIDAFDSTGKYNGFWIVYLDPAGARMLTAYKLSGSTLSQQPKWQTSPFKPDEVLLHGKWVSHMKVRVTINTAVVVRSANFYRRGTLQSDGKILLDQVKQ